MAYAWHQAVLRQVLANRKSLPHALLLSGPENTGKAEFAHTLATLLLCRNAPEDAVKACGQCHSCRLIAANTHPDLMQVGLETAEDDKQAKEIKVDQIRGLCRRLAQTSQFGGYKIAVIQPADRMNRNAANSLLKTLEEPPEGTLLLLVSGQPSLLPATIRSRCQRVKLPPPSREIALEWLRGQFPELDAGSLLAAAGGAPKLAATLAGGNLLKERLKQMSDLKLIAARRQNPVAVAAQWQKGPPAPLALNWWLAWICDLIALAMGEPDRVENMDLQKDLQALSSRIDLGALFLFKDRLQEATRTVFSSVNVQLLLESLLLQWENITGNPRVNADIH